MDLGKTVSVQNVVDIEDVDTVPINVVEDVAVSVTAKV